MVKDRETWRAAVHRVAKSWTGLSSWTTTTTLQKLGCPSAWIFLYPDLSWPLHLFTHVSVHMSSFQEAPGPRSFHPSPITFWPYRLTVSWAAVTLKHSPLFFLPSFLSPWLNYTWDQVLCVYPLPLYHQSLGQLLAYSRCSISAGLMNIACLLCAGHPLKSPGFRDEWLFSSPNRYILQEIQA